MNPYLLHVVKYEKMLNDKNKSFLSKKLIHTIYSIDSSTPLGKKLIDTILTIERIQPNSVQPNSVQPNSVQSNNCNFTKTRKRKLREFKMNSS